jgi:hypothetical protein
MSNKPARIFAFDRVYVTAAPNGTKVIEWRLNTCFPIPYGTPEFYIEFARSAGEWERLNEDEPVVNSCVYVDPEKRRCGYDNNVYYRVVMVVGGETYNSKPERTIGVWNKHDWLIARDVVRKEYLRLKRYVGTFGYLLRKREHGVPCTDCQDFDTEETISANCGGCFGTGIIGGYYDAIPYYVDLSGTASQRDVQSPFGDVDNRRRSARAVAYPMVTTYDLWIDADKNKRYVIRQVEMSVEIKGRPLVYNFELRELPANAIEYQIPLEQDLSETIGIAPTDPESQGWRKDIDFIEVDCQ